MTTWQARERFRKGNDKKIEHSTKNTAVALLGGPKSPPTDQNQQIIPRSINRQRGIIVSQPM
jgi:hypothetical protein